VRVDATPGPAGAAGSGRRDRSRGGPGGSRPVGAAWRLMLAGLHVTFVHAVPVDRGLQAESLGFVDVGEAFFQHLWVTYLGMGWIVARSQRSGG